MKKDVKTELSRRMKVRMFELGMTEQTLAKKTGVSDRSISNYITRKNTMKADALAAIAEALECSSDWMLGLANKKEKV